MRASDSQEQEKGAATIPRNGQPKYAALADELETAILSGRYRVGDQLPAERELAKTHGMTAMTVRQALKALSEKGLITRERGRGTFVSTGRVPDVRKEAIAPVYLLGLNPAATGSEDTVNWQTLMRRFQGIVDASFQLGTPLQTHLDVDLGMRPDRLAERLSSFSGILLHEELLPESTILRLQDAGVPVVAMNCYADRDCCSRVHVNSRQGAYRAVSHLIGLGHRRIGIITGDPSRVSMEERLAGYEDALAAHGLPIDKDLVVVDPRGRRQDGAEAACRVLATKNPPTAIFGASDYRAIGALEALKERGVNVPREMSVVGFDDIQEAASTDPPLTTVRNPLYESGRMALQLLLELRDAKRPCIRVVLMAPDLVERESCAPCKSPDGKPRAAVRR